jgi:hypothetical protein
VDNEERNISESTGICSDARHPGEERPNAQLQLPLFPAGVIEITPHLAFKKEDGQIVYFNGHMPVAIHDEKDLRTFRVDFVSKDPADFMPRDVCAVRRCCCLMWWKRPKSSWLMT